MGVDELLKEKREDVLRLAAKHGARDVRVLARGEAGSDSDVDFLVTTGPETSSWFPAGLIIDLQELLGREVDGVTENGLHWYVRERILKEAVPL